MPKTNQPDPYAAARERHSDRYLNLSKARSLWQTTTFLLAGVSAILALGLVHLSSTALVVPYLVTVDHHGQAVFRGTPEQIGNNDPRLIARELANLIVYLRTVSVDPAVNRTNLVRGYAHLSGSAEAYLTRELSTANNPLSLAAHLQRVIDIESSLPIEGTNSWALHWRETSTASNQPARESAWTATLTVEFRDPPADLALLQHNPLGLYVTGLTWTEVSTTHKP